MIIASFLSNLEAIQDYLEMLKNTARVNVVEPL